MEEDIDHYYMGLALDEAKKAWEVGEVPIGAVIVRDGEIIGRGHNLRECDRDPTAHAEVLAIKEASQAIENWRLTGSTIYVTLEPCLMCMGALILARVERIVFGPFDPKGGAAGSLYDVSNDPRLNHAIDVVSGVRADEGSQLLKDFFSALRQRRKKKSRDK